MGVIDLYNPKKIKDNWNKVRSNPYASLKFQYYVSFGLIIFLILFISYTLFKLIINYDGGSSMMTLAMRGIMIVVGVVIAFKAYGVLTPLKNAMKHYENNPSTNKTSSVEIDVGKEVDEILKNIELNKQAIIGNAKLNQLKKKGVKNVKSKI